MRASFVDATPTLGALAERLGAAATPTSAIAWVLNGLGSAVLSLLACLVPGHALAQSQQAPSDVQRWRSVFQAIAEQNEQRLMVGDIDGYVEVIRKTVKAEDWASQLVAGDVVYRVSPAAAIAFHEAAARLAPDRGVTHLELAFDYQRTGQCERAIPAWQAAERLGALGSPATAVAAHCFFRAGRIEEALALWSRVQWPGHRVPVDFALSEMAIGSLALDRHAKAWVLASAGDAMAMRTLVGNALEWRVDWWNAGPHRKALDATRELARRVRPSDVQFQRELDCAIEASGARDADSVLGLLRRCGLLIEKGEMPASSEVAKFLIARLDATKAAPLGDLLHRFGPLLEARARGAEGDLTALEILAFLQVGARDRAALSATDELGWRRYRVAKFAVSRVIGARADKQEWDAHGERLLKEALDDFPEEALLHALRYEAFPPTASLREPYLVGWLLAEYARLSGNSYPGVGIGPPTSTTLASVVLTLRKRREERSNLPS